MIQNPKKNMQRNTKNERPAARLYAEGRAIKTVLLACLLLLSCTLLLTACDMEDILKLEFFGPETPEASGSEWKLGQVRVAVGGADGVTVSSQNPLDVDLGTEASFELQLEDGVVIESVSGNARVENGRLVLDEVFAPTTVRISTRRLVRCDFFADSADAAEGSVSSTLENGAYWSETEVTLNATPAENFKFLGYTVGKTLDEGGEIVSSAQTYTFSLSESLQIFANFASVYVDPATTVTVPRDRWVLLYHPNGGVLSSTGKDEMHTEYFQNGYYHCPNALQNEGQFTREGHVLLGYNTAPDGSGTYYAPGWNIIMPERGAISLYCVWLPETPASSFSYQKINNGKEVAITRYNGSDETVVVPETIEGLPVVTLATGAFQNRRSMETLFISRNVTTVQSNCIVACPKLESLYFSDSVLTIDDTSIVNCTAFSTLYMMATRRPYYPTSRNGTYAIKYERLITAPGRKLVITSGSNSAYGINSPLLESLLKAGGHEYSVVNYGTNASTSACFYIEVISHFINEGDVLLHEGEYNQYQWGYNEINTTLWQIFEGAYDAFSLVDVREYTKLFSSFSTFNQARDKGGKFYSYDSYTSDTVNEYGDYSKNKVGMTSGYKSDVEKYKNNGNYGSTKIQTTTDTLTKQGGRFERVLKMVVDRGGDVVFSFPVILTIALNADSQKTGSGTQQDKCEKAIDNLKYGTRISKIETYLFEEKYLYNSNYHVNSEGAIVRTNLIATDLLAYFNKQKS